MNQLTRPKMLKINSSEPVRAEKWHSPFVTGL
ncbi:MAG: hypothetical protein JWM33_2738 [Caulobacteraceae bacterium]|nr:hypothetical protein [Caulobacteraceae bacterium]